MTDAYLDSYGLAAAFVLVLVKSVGIPIPIPGDVILLATAARAAEGKVSPVAAFLVLLLALVAGGFTQFGLAGGPARSLLYRRGSRIGLSPGRLDGAGAVLRRGVLGLGLAVLTPGVRTAAIPAAGLAGVPPLTFGLGLLLGSAADLALHFGIGFLGVAWLGALADAVPEPQGILGTLALLAASFGVWRLLRRRARTSGAEDHSLAEAALAWQDSACPACLVLGAVGASLERVGVERHPAMAAHGH